MSACSACNGGAVSPQAPTYPVDPRQNSVMTVPATPAYGYGGGGMQSTLTQPVMTQQQYAGPVNQCQQFDPCCPQPLPPQPPQCWDCDREPLQMSPCQHTNLPPGLRGTGPCNPPPPGSTCAYYVPGGKDCPPWVRWGGPVGFNPGWGGSLWPATKQHRR